MDFWHVAVNAIASTSLTELQPRRAYRPPSAGPTTISSVASAPFAQQPWRSPICAMSAQAWSRLLDKKSAPSQPYRPGENFPSRKAVRQRFTETPRDSRHARGGCPA
jgi:hypothetical protein